MDKGCKQVWRGSRRIGRIRPLRTASCWGRGELRCLLCVKRPQLELNRRAIQQAVQHITAAHDCSALNVYNHAAGGCGARHGHVTIDSGTGLGQQQTGTCTHSGDAFTKRRARGREGAAKDAALRSDTHNHSPCTTAVFCCVGRQRTRHICSLYALGARPGFAATAPHRLLTSELRAGGG